MHESARRCAAASTAKVYRFFAPEISLFTIKSSDKEGANVSEAYILS